MKLIDDRGTVISNPKPSQIRDLVMTLSHEDAFAILESADQFYIQTAGTIEDDFVLEYREGSADKHFGVYEPRLTAEEIIIVFTEYASSKDDYKLRYFWKKMF